jgi:hypothetical protein
VAKRAFQALLVFFAAGFCVGSYWLYKSAFDVVLEPKDVVNLKVREEPKFRPLVLRMDGATASSAMSIYKIATRTDGSTITLLVHAGLAKRGTSGTFHYDLSVPDSVDEVQFGRSSTAIWHRSPSRTPTSNAWAPTTPISRF